MAKDNFSDHAPDYANYRPTYPTELIDFVVSETNIRLRALDVATGNGQVAVALANSFEHVDAIDLSAQQLEQAKQKHNVNYQVSFAENTPFEKQSFDLIAVAQALHWFKIDSFLDEMKRIAKPECVLSVWGYGKSLVSEEIDSIFNDFHLRKLAKYWDPERDHIEAEYNDLSLPISRVVHPQFKIKVNWTRAKYISYIQTWSAVRHFQKANDHDPTLELARDFKLLWPDDEVRQINFPIFIYLGKLQ